MGGNIISRPETGRTMIGGTAVFCHIIDNTTQSISVFGTESTRRNGHLFHRIGGNSHTLRISKRIIDGNTVDLISDFVGTSAADVNISRVIYDHTCLQGNYIAQTVHR